jgi:hypothetical protein
MHWQLSLAQVLLAGAVLLKVAAAGDTADLQT